MKKLIATAVAVLALGVGALVGAPAANAAGYEGTDPDATGCSTGAYVVTSWNMVNLRYGQVQGRVELVYSPKCSTNWVNVYGYTAGNRYLAGVQVAPRNWYNAQVNGVASQHSLQVVAPGNTCVNIGWSIADIAMNRIEGSDSKTIC